MKLQKLFLLVLLGLNFVSVASSFDPDWAKKETPGEKVLRQMQMVFGKDSGKVFCNGHGGLNIPSDIEWMQQQFDRDPQGVLALLAKNQQKVDKYALEKTTQQSVLFFCLKNKIPFNYAGGYKVLKEKVANTTVAKLVPYYLEKMLPLVSLARQKEDFQDLKESLAEKHVSVAGEIQAVGLAGDDGE